jgi:arsenite methyltransferase
MMEAPENVKSCCADLYAGDWARLLLGDSFHPGGTRLTERMGRLMCLDATSRVLDVAAGRGASALHLARAFGCQVVGVDLSRTNLDAAREEARRAQLDSLVRFEVADAEALPHRETFDAVICECAFCTFPDKAAAATGMARAVRHGGRIGFSDLVRTGPLPAELEGLLAWVACVADARPVDDYRRHLEEAGFSIDHVEDQRVALVAMVREIQARLLGAKVMIGLKKLDLPGADLEKGKAMARTAMEAVHDGTLSYAVLIGTRS